MEYRRQSGSARNHTCSPKSVQQLMGREPRCRKDMAAADRILRLSHPAEDQTQPKGAKIESIGYDILPSDYPRIVHTEAFRYIEGVVRVLAVRNIDDDRPVLSDIPERARNPADAESTRPLWA